VGRWLGIADETVFGTPVTPPTLFLDCIAIGLHPEREPMKVPSMALIGPAAGKMGSYKILGDIEIHPSSENIAKLLKFVFGTPTTIQDSPNPIWKHTYVPSDVMKFGTLYKADDVQPDGVNALQYISVASLSCRLEAALDAPVSMTFGCFGQKDAKVTKPALGAVSTIAQFFSIQGKLYWDIAQATEEPNIDSVSLTYTRALAEDFYSMNDAFLKGFIPGEATIEGSLDLMFKSWEAYQKFWGGASGPVAEPAMAALSLDFTGPSIGGSGEFTNHRMKWQLPAVQIHSIDNPFRLRDKIMQTVTFSGVRGVIDATSLLCRVILINSISGTAV